MFNGDNRILTSGVPLTKFYEYVFVKIWYWPGERKGKGLARGMGRRGDARFILNCDATRLVGSVRRTWYDDIRATTGKTLSLPVCAIVLTIFVARMRYGRCIICTIQWERCAGNDITVKYRPPATGRYSSFSVRSNDSLLWLYAVFGTRIMDYRPFAWRGRCSLIKDYIRSFRNTRDAVFGTIDFISIFSKDKIVFFLSFWK